jgi:hypothetical protein
MQHNHSTNFQANQQPHAHDNDTRHPTTPAATAPAEHGEHEAGGLAATVVSLRDEVLEDAGLAAAQDHGQRGGLDLAGTLKLHLRVDGLIRAGKNGEKEKEEGSNGVFKRLRCNGHQVRQEVASTSAQTVPQRKHEAAQTVTQRKHEAAQTVTQRKHEEADSRVELAACRVSITACSSAAQLQTGRVRHTDAPRGIQEVLVKIMSGAGGDSATA